MCFSIKFLNDLIQDDEEDLGLGEPLTSYNM